MLYCKQLTVNQSGSPEAEYLFCSSFFEGNEETAGPPTSEASAGISLSEQGCFYLPLYTPIQISFNKAWPSE